MPEEIIEELLRNLETLLIRILERVDEGRSTTISRTRRTGLLNDIGGILVDLTIGIDPLKNAAREEFAQNARVDPLIDVIENENAMKLIILLPGVKKEDVSVETRENSIVLRIRRGEETYYKEIPRGDLPCEITVDSVVENNSVLEITFNKSGCTFKHL